MNHKRRRPKNRRSGCLLCKPHKQNGYGSRCLCATSNGRQEIAARSDLAHYFKGEAP